MEVEGGVPWRQRPEGLNQAKTTHLEAIVEGVWEKRGRQGLAVGANCT